MNSQDGFPLYYSGGSQGKNAKVVPSNKGLSRVFSNTTVQKQQFFGAQPSSQSNSHIHMTTGKTIALTRRTYANLKRDLGGTGYPLLTVDVEAE